VIDSPTFDDVFDAFLAQFRGSTAAVYKSQSAPFVLWVRGNRERIAEKKLTHDEIWASYLHTKQFWSEKAGAQTRSVCLRFLKFAAEKGIVF